MVGWVRSIVVGPPVSRDVVLADVRGAEVPAAGNMLRVFGTDAAG